jgi:RimJ/RimL family protein N-acetyltransferase
MEPLTFAIPRIRTERLLLREPRRADFDGFAENLADPEATLYLSGVSDRRTAWRIYLAATGAWVLDGKGWWAIELRETGAMVGTVGVFVRESAPDFEIGWTVFRPHWRSGYAAEAARAALHHAFAHYGARRVIAYIDPKNEASIGVSQKIGMSFDADADFYGQPASRYAIDAPPRAG